MDCDSCFIIPCRSFHGLWNYNFMVDVYHIISKTLLSYILIIEYVIEMWLWCVIKRIDIYNEDRF